MKNTPHTRNVTPALAFWPASAEALLQQFNCHESPQAARQSTMSGSPLHLTFTGRALLSIAWAIYCTQHALRGSVSFETSDQDGAERACLRLHDDDAPAGALPEAGALLSDGNGDQWRADTGVFDVVIVEDDEGSATFAAVPSGATSPVLSAAGDLGTLLAQLLPADCTGMAAWAASGQGAADGAR
jgi:hypothetical protein